MRHYVAEEKFTFAENCEGLTTSCPASQEESRTMCMFKLFLSCLLILQACFRIYWIQNFCEKPIILSLRAVLEDLMDNLCAPKNCPEKSGRDFSFCEKTECLYSEYTFWGHALLFI